MIGGGPKIVWLVEPAALPLAADEPAPLDPPLLLLVESFNAVAVAGLASAPTVPASLLLAPSFGCGANFVLGCLPAVEEVDCESFALAAARGENAFGGAAIVASPGLAPRNGPAEASFAAGS